MQQHIDERLLAEYLASPDVLSAGERDSIERHLAACALCRQLRGQLTEFSARYGKIAAGAPEDGDVRAADRILPSRAPAIRERLPERRMGTALDAYAEIIEPRDRSIARRTLHLMRVHPVRTFAGVSLAAALIATLLLTRAPSRDVNPFYAQVRQFSLSVYNRGGELLWKHGVVGMGDLNCTGQTLTKGQSPRGCLDIADIDGDGTTEVLLAGVNDKDFFTSDSLYCFEHDGRLRWAIQAGPIISFGDTTRIQHAMKDILDVFVLRRTADSRPQLFYIANEHGFSPTKIAEVDPATGKQLHALYKRGGSGLLAAAQLEHDGITYLIAAGINDGFNNADLLAVDPAAIDGYAPVPEQYQPATAAPAKLRHYLLFPLTPIEKDYGSTAYNMVSTISILSGAEIRCAVQSHLNRAPVAGFAMQVIYSLDSAMRVTSVVPGDGLIKTEARLNEYHLLAHSLIPGYLNSLKDSVRYWNGREFVRSGGSAPLMYNP